MSGEFKEGFQAFTDGACSGNPGPGGWGVVLFDPRGWVRELGGGEARTTNNAMELRAAIETLRALEGVKGDLELVIDSKYVVQGITQWISGWEKRGWTTTDGSPVLNQELWRELQAAVDARAKKGFGNLRWNRIDGHSGIPGNDRADAIAVAFSQGGRPPLFNGEASGYAIQRSDAMRPSGKVTRMPSSKKDAKALFYLSLVDGRLERHATWPECERRVKGVAGARFRKVTAPAEEAEILASWGVKIPPF